MKLPPVRACLLGLLASLLLAGCASQPAQVAAPRVPEQVSNAEWAGDMARFAAEDAAHPPPRDAVLFVGSSSIRLWKTLAEDFPGVAVINRGFGGSEIRDSTWYADRIVVPYAPRLIVFYAGDNDLASGRSPQQLHDDFLAFVRRVRRDLPSVPIAFVSCKPSPSRAHLLGAQREANALIRAEAAKLKRVAFVDVFAPMLDANGQPREELFIADRLHMNAAGYAIWRDALAPYLQPGAFR